MLQDARSTTKLMDYARGDERNVTGENIGDLLEEMKRASVAEVEDEYKTKLETQKQ